MELNDYGQVLRTIKAVLRSRYGQITRRCNVLSWLTGA